MILLILFLIIPNLASSQSGVIPYSVERTALETELGIARPAPERYYLVVDLYAKAISLKAGGRELMTAAVTESHTEDVSAPVTTYYYSQRISPHVPIASQAGNRLAGRRLPLDFAGRLIEGPRRHDRLYFEPALVICSERAPHTGSVPYILISGVDLKSLSSAVDATTAAILINPSKR